MSNKPICKVDANGVKWWISNHKLHREDGPAVELSDGSKGWFINDKCHREDGPAIEQANGHKYWYLDDDRYSKKDYYRELVKRGIMAYEDAVLELI